MSGITIYVNLLEVLKKKREDVRIHNAEQLEDFIDKSLEEEGVCVTPYTESLLFQNLNYYDKR